MFVKLACLLMVQDFPAQTVKKWSLLIHRYFRRWIGLAKSSEPSILYRSNENFGLNFKDLRQVEKQLRVIKWHIIKYSKDSQLRQLFQYRLDLDRRGHIGKGNKTSFRKFSDFESSGELRSTWSARTRFSTVLSQG